MPEEVLEIRGARVHNLKNIDLDLPHNQLVVVTGVSGSGKSSLVFDVVFAEGRRRYVEALSSYARQFLDRIEKPDVDQVNGIAPTVAIRQKNSIGSARSTVATATEIHDYLRLLFSRIGRTHCHKCGARVESDTVASVVDHVLRLPQRSRWYVLFPVRTEVAAAGGASSRGASRELSGDLLKARLTALRERGFGRLFQDAKMFEFSSPESLLDIDFSKPVYVLADRVAIQQRLRQRLADTVELAYRESGEVRFEQHGSPDRHLRFSAAFECGKCGIAHVRFEPHAFSLNSVESACPRCRGTGRSWDYVISRVISRPDLPLASGPIPVWNLTYRSYQRTMLTFAYRVGIPIDVPYCELSPEHRRAIEEGCVQFGGVRGFLRRLEKKRWKAQVAAQLARWRRSGVCPKCDGDGFKAQIRNVKVGGQSISQVLSLSLSDALGFFENLALTDAEAGISAELLTQIGNRLRFLNRVGLHYLTLDRPAKTLSGGEAQRVQLATSLGSRLVGVCYVLDEPSIGLHSRDTERLIGILKELRDLGNSVFVVEHDHAMMRTADHLVDLGPGAGAAGGEVVFSGLARSIVSEPRSVTGGYLSGRKRITVPVVRRQPSQDRRLRFKGARKNNLKSLDFAIPVGLLTAVTGVSGSGKSTLLHEVVFSAVNSQTDRKVGMGRLGPIRLPASVPCEEVAGLEHLLGVVEVGQGLQRVTSRSVPATYMGWLGPIRKLFARTAQAKRLGLTAGAFSFNSSTGRCGVCKGRGEENVPMQFLADVRLPCEECRGKRYRPEVLDVTLRGKSIWDVLQLTVSEAMEFFEGERSIRAGMNVLAELGLGYLRLGQPLTQLSGGEAQRLMLAHFIAGSDRKVRDTLFLFDEPTTGLHAADIRLLVAALEALIERGATVAVIEHNLDVIKCADWVLDLGPGGGDDGGELVAEGPPEALAEHPRSPTAAYLREVLS